ncbi:pancreatic lipase-related protein 2 isoform X1 [Drosophila sulfurigaster albostrigata]|uniref:pancreatic lipase-related protein 2 isoform X1 n=1 Tax=Drosophila sulfurigaster albostrigata TaxID=89887 RepID=UPI002D21DB83|nr:pancreatic lipase-related protein 2 isoform X1 [Drosophila sulfurigaster albostrigata]
MPSNALACICNVINPCRNEVSTTFVVVQWLITGFAALSQVVRPVLLLFGIRGEVALNQEDYNRTWIYMPNGEGKPEVAYLVEPPPENRISLPQLIQFEYYGSDAPDDMRSSSFWIDENNFQRDKRDKRDTWQEMAEKFDPNLDTKILVHGWKSSTMSNSIQSIRGAYLQRGQVNVFAINWRDQADNIYYLTPARYTVQVGRAVAKLIDLLVEEKDADPQRIHLIGHSLGAHIMGYAGSYTKYRVSRVTGLDPARPAFEDCIGPENHLDNTDANFVDVIHSCAGYLGFRKPIGMVDFYPNGGGPPQPGCSEISQIFTGCSHGRSYEYYAESINSDKGFYGVPCTTLDQMKGKNCTGGRILMGDRVPQDARGIYLVKTANKPSYALGMDDLWPKDYNNNN